MTLRVRHPRHRKFDGLERGRLDHMMADIAVSGVGDVRWPAVGDDTADSITLTGAGDVLESALRVVFTTTDTLPAGLSPGVIYYLGANLATDEYDIHASLADLASTTNVDIIDTGTGTHTAHLF